ncbi:hypothetical protein L6654_24170 [Bradyrhizobium sp. WYCCWR 13023]|uniref:Uncharacterized protein n=1 Tax=Bradyrhizobium zhengyangense TaxID=2911009 RepID=A0A9X1RFM2_9BRAD|nr:hypothetical protein [Bradyrhizobium zhengyangense]MCG2629724.1 hypothetical protein [Bradyrhizobium zhengyangense]
MLNVRNEQSDRGAILMRDQLTTFDRLRDFAPINAEQICCCFLRNSNWLVRFSDHDGTSLAESAASEYWQLPRAV